MQSGNYGGGSGNIYCEKCGYPSKPGANFCKRCGNDLRKNHYFYDADNQMQMRRDADRSFQKIVRENYYARYGFQPVAVTKNDWYIENSNKEKSPGIKVSNLIITIICGILWLVAPFEAINILTLGEQPSAFQLVSGEDLLYLGELVESTAFWAALISIIGISVCFIATLTKSNAVCRAFAIISLIPMILTMIEMFTWAEEMETFASVFGFGYWAILILLFVLICNSGGNKKYY